MRKISGRTRSLLGFGVGFCVFVFVFQSEVVYNTEVDRSGLHDHHLIIQSEVETDTNLEALKRRRENEYHLHHNDNKVANELVKTVRVLCWIMTSPNNYRKRADAVKSTWGRRCNVLLFFSSTHDDSLPTIALNVSEGRKHLTAKTMLAFEYVHRHYADQADWFMKCDDDTYVIVENLRYFLSAKNATEPIYFGQHFHKNVKQGYFSGGAGYVLSKEALNRFAKRDLNLCSIDGGAEDVQIGKCFERLGVTTGNSTDKIGRSRFHCFSPETHLSGAYPSWYNTWTAGTARQGLENISDYAISFHYQTPRQMMSLEFFVYHLRPYGIVSRNQVIN